MVLIRREKSGQIGLFLWNFTSFATQPAGIENDSAAAATRGPHRPGHHPARRPNGRLEAGEVGMRAISW
jgi:hypothetical protein